jgi:hypothetical protein
MSALWPPAETAQADYEQLRAAVLAGVILAGPTSARFETQGLWGLIRRPSTTTAFKAALVGACRPAWSPYSDPRLEVLVEVYELLLEPAGLLREETGT